MKLASYDGAWYTQKNGTAVWQCRSHWSNDHILAFDKIQFKIIRVVITRLPAILRTLPCLLLPPHLPPHPAPHPLSPDVIIVIRHASNTINHLIPRDIRFTTTAEWSNTEIILASGLITGQGLLELARNLPVIKYLSKDIPIDETFASCPISVRYRQKMYCHIMFR